MEETRNQNNKEQNPGGGGGIACSSSCACNSFRRSVFEASETREAASEPSSSDIIPMAAAVPVPETESTRVPAKTREKARATHSLLKSVGFERENS